MRPRCYLFLVAAFFAGLYGSAAMLNWRVDPFAIWGFSSRTELTQEPHPRLVKAHWILDADPQGLVIGNSHAGGFGEATFARYFPGQRFYNGYLQGAQIYELERYASHYLALAPHVETIVLSIDLFDFFDQERVDRTFAEGRLAVRPDGTRNPFWRVFDAPSTLVSWSAIGRSIRVLAGVSARVDTSRTGFNLCDPTAGGDMVAEIHGSAVRHYLNRFTSKPLLGRDGEPYWRAGIAALLSTVAAGGRRVYVVIPPVHASVYVAMAETGYLEAHFQMIGEIARAASAHDTMRVFDFTGPGDYVDDTGLAPDERSQYWEDSDHFTCRLGDRMVARMLGLEADERFGAELTLQNADAHIAGLRASFEVWLKTPKADAYRAWLRASPDPGG